ncbi:O-antigen ligase family protein [Agreia pratensis]|uniref:O-antigen ligase family protein n=1 Tax=Agreia pratensis TaxID=150121 RepID=UPI002B26FAD1|nr:O-antigen ligase family protein [Agreia pratensis]
MRVSEHPGWAVVAAIFGSPRFSGVLATTAIGSALSVNLVKETMGWAGLIGILSTLVVFAAVSLVARRKDLDWHGVLPLSLVVFLGWCAITIVWSRYPSSSVTGVIYQLTFSFLALYVALVRDLIQIVRAVGDVMRVLLTVSLALEILSGLLLDLPIAFLRIQGNLDEGGPLQGIFGSRNMLGFIALIALVTFLVERNTRSVPRGLSLYSIVLAAVLLLGSRSPISLGVAGIVFVAAVAVLALRRARPELRRSLQIGMLVILVIGTLSAYFVRTRILAIVGARSEFTYRLEIWNQLSSLIDYNQLEGWGWVGLWRPNVSPFFALDFVGNRQHTSGLNAFIDVYFQAGLIGLVIFVGMAGLALVRSWILATSKKSVIYMWPALILIVLLVTSMAESAMLVEYGWMFFVMCMVKAAHSLSWRQGLALKPPTAELPRAGA